MWALRNTIRIYKVPQFIVNSHDISYSSIHILVLQNMSILFQHLEYSSSVKIWKPSVDTSFRYSFSISIVTLFNIHFTKKNLQGGDIWPCTLSYFCFPLNLIWIEIKKKFKFRFLESNYLKKNIYTYTLKKDLIWFICRKF